MKKGMMIWVLLLLFFLFSACSNQANNSDNEDQVRQYMIKLYYVNTDYVLTGNESLDRLLSLEKEIEGTKKTIYLNTISALQEEPSDEAYGTEISKDITFNDVNVKEGIAYVDVSTKNLNGSSLQERFFIDQIVKTLIESFEEIEAVQFLVEGKKVESLMGHITASEPFYHLIND